MRKLLLSVLSCYKKKARVHAPELKHLYQARKKKLLKERAKVLQAKQVALMRLQEKKV